jgi:hypothetical protein
MPTRQELEATFRRLGIDFTHPGFCDSPEFQAVERENPVFLKSYAEYVQKLELPAEYLDRARPVIQETAEFLFNQLVADGRRGACVDISGVVLRFLERQGIWCHVACGGVKVEFPPEARMRPRWFHPLMHPNNNAFTGHAWIYAPPFEIVDVSISLQPYSAEQQRYFNGYTLAEQVGEPAEPIGVRDLMENELVEEHVRRFGRLPTMQDISPDQRQFLKEFPAHRIVKDGVSFTYTPVKISAPDMSLEQMLHPTLSGRRPVQVFEEFQNRNNGRPH